MIYYSNSGIETKIENCKIKLSRINIIQKREAPERIPRWELSDFQNMRKKL